MAIKRDLPPGFSLYTFAELPEGYQSTSWTPDGQLSVTTNHTIYIWDEENTKWQPIVEANNLAVTYWSRSGNWLAVLCNDTMTNKEIGPDTINVIHRASGHVKWTIQGLRVMDMLIRELIPDQPVLDIATRSDGLLLWDSTDQRLKRAIGKRPKEICRIADSEKTGMLASAYVNGEVLVEGPDPDRIQHLGKHKEEVRSLAWSPDGKYLVSGSLDGGILVFDPAESTRIKTLDASGNGGVGSLGFTPDGRLLFSASYAGILAAWRTDTWEEIDFERDYDSYPVLGAMEMQMNPVKSELVAPIDNVSERENRAHTLSILRIDTDMLLGKKTETRAFGRSPSQADNVSRVDHLGRQEMVNALAAMLSDKKQGTPFTIGIFGNWGSGKSSLFEQLKLRLENDKTIPYRFANFNAWEFEHTDNLAAGLAQQVVRALTDHNPVNRLLLRVRFAWRKHRGHFFGGILAALLALAGFILTFFTSIDVKKVADINQFKVTINEIRAAGGIVMIVAAALYALTFLKKLYQHPLSTRLLTYLNLPKYGKYLGLIPVLQDDIKLLSKLQLGDDLDIKGRLLVFVDDLDRCAPASILHVFEAIRLIMDTHNVIVLVALDARMSMQAVAHEYKDLATDQRPAEEIARDYIGKIFQLAITMKPPDPDNIKEYIEQGLFPGVKTASSVDMMRDARKRTDDSAKTAAGEENATLTALEEAMRTPTPINKTTEQIIADMEHTPDELEHFETLCQQFGFTNPRLLRRLRNSYRLLKVVERSEGYFKLMNMLFWFEYMFTLPPELQVQCDDYFRHHTPFPNGPAMLPVEISQIVEFVELELEIGEDYERLGHIVLQLVMPRQKPQKTNQRTTENVRTDPDTADNQYNTEQAPVKLKKRTTRKRSARKKTISNNSA